MQSRRLGWIGVILVCGCALGLLGCGDGGGDGGEDGGGGDVGDAQVEAEASSEDVGAEDAAAEAVDAASEDADAGPVELETRHFTFRSMAGMSMGAAASTIASHNPGMFDTVGALGGYVDFRYLSKMVRHNFMGGFCPMAQILENLDHINDPNHPGVFCGPVPVDQPYEFPWDFNHWQYETNGGGWAREFYWDTIEGFQFTFGNMFSYNPDHPLLPPGVPIEWFQETSDHDKCTQPGYAVGKPWNFNAEYNPEGEYELVTFCDGDTPIGCTDDDPPLCGEDHPDFWELMADYDPTQPHDRPIPFLMAVDYNGNGFRDYGEPVVINWAERFEDLGADGCASAREDGQGGCLAAGEPDASGDPNGDDFDLFDNYTGTEGNFWFNEGEPYEDFGLDGVAEAVSGVKDEGEANGVHDINPNLRAIIDQDLHTYFTQAPLEELEAINWYFDAGIRDVLHSCTATSHAAQTLNLRLPVSIYDGFTTLPTSLAPDIVNCVSLKNELATHTWSSDHIGRNVFVRYGDPNASDYDIQLGDGKHVGDGCEVVNRMLSFYTVSNMRLPDPVLVADGDMSGRGELRTFYSPAMQDRRWFGINLPPGYDEPENDDVTYPLSIFLTGHGITVENSIIAGTIYTIEMALGQMPRFIMLNPDGQCCHRQRSTGQRFCACVRVSEGYDCVDPLCTGEHEECDIQNIPGNDLTQECNHGNLYTNHVTNHWGDVDVADQMGYEDTVLELIEYVEQRYRVRPPGDFEVPVGL